MGKTSQQLKVLCTKLNETHLHNFALSYIRAKFSNTSGANSKNLFYISSRKTIDPIYKIPYLRGLCFTYPKALLLAIANLLSS